MTVVKTDIWLPGKIMEFLAPRQCAICYKEGEIICYDCRSHEFGDLESRCYICNKLTKQNVVCGSHRSSSGLRRVWWVGHYEKTLKELIWRLKFHRARDYGTTLGRLMAEHLPYLPDGTVVVPVATASSRIRRRGYNQAEIIASSLAKERNLQIERLLGLGSQNEQVGKRRTERIRAMKDAFYVKNKDIPENILLVDDVLTTGATLEAAARTLRLAGAKHVDAAVVARRVF